MRDKVNYEKLVMDLYPQTTLHTNNLKNGCVIHEVWVFDGDPTKMLEVTAGFTKRDAWEQTWEKIEKRMLRKLSE